MPFKINDFKRNLTYGGARPSLFQVEVMLPTQLGDAVNNGVDGRQLTGSMQKLTFLANAATIPGSKVPEIAVPYFGRKVKVAGTREFDDWTVTIINDEDFLVRKTLEHWMASINGHSTNIRNSGVNASPSSYQAEAFVKHYSKGPTENPIRCYKFVNIFPTDVSPIELSWASTDAIEEFRVTFAYDWWEIDTSGDITPPTGNTLA